AMQKTRGAHIISSVFFESLASRQLPDAGSPAVKFQKRGTLEDAMQKTRGAHIISSVFFESPPSRNFRTPAVEFRGHGS
ncbi:MAG: hypothetical protein ACI4PW_07375, partial [Alphaproteobacteria bacterium]